ncbi:DNA replication/repair protein RecF [Sphingorhabdus sp. 109]|jgi:DNA replication and repair protein RecF|uniref:DNA replication/repair protein RecF n=1 Tax=Sphingorhabdus sp. 109 TaxID=2653173 RepID=UPI0012EF1A3E|nr:DNA replication/repair protein RecF [Sphingorhabdus sp. 109]VWX56179.1 DNA replication and repair protein RecF [Sphingorhabdus sp. 109]
MTLSQLTLHNFRNYRELRLEAAPGFMVFSGANGAGKTNILEAVSLLAPGRGLRRAPLRDIAHQNGPGDFAVAAQHDDVHLGSGTSIEAPERRKTRINEASVPTNDLAEWLSILWLTPAMDRLFTEGASGRRNFLDRLVTALEPAHARNCARYEAARRERNRLLADSHPADQSWIDGLDTQLAQFGGFVAEARERMVSALNQRLQQSESTIFATPAMELADGDMRSEQQLLQMLQQNRGVDRAAGRTTRGPHRADLKVLHAAKQQPAEKCSTGEQKALLFSIILAHADLVAERRDKRPILLLDEVAAHLDPQRRAALFDKLAERGGQVWLTGTEPELFGDVPDDALHFEVSDGTVTRR